MHRKNLIILSVVLFIVIVGAIAIFALGRAPQQTVPVMEAQAVSSIDFTLQDLSGKSHTLSDYRGKLVFLNFWATWCPPCRSEMPSMQKLYEKADKKKFVMLAVNAKEDVATVRAFAQKNGYTFPILLDPDYKISGKYQVQAIPLTFLVDQQGNIIGRICGAREWKWEQLEPLVK